MHYSATQLPTITSQTASSSTSPFELPPWQLLTAFQGVGIFLILTREGSTRSGVGKNVTNVACPEAKVHGWNRTRLGLGEWNIQSSWNGWGFQGEVERSTSWRNEPVQSAEGNSRLPQTSHVTWTFGIYEHSGLILVSLLSKKAGALCHLFIIFFTTGRRAEDSIRALQRVITRFICRYSLCLGLRQWQ